MYCCEFCDAKYISESGIYKHRRTKHFVKKKIPNKYFCNDCEMSFKVKKTLIHHVKCHIPQKSHFKCSFENCFNSFFSMAGYISHLKTSHGKNIALEQLVFDTMEGMYL